MYSGGFSHAYFDTISMGLPIVYFKGTKVEVSKLWCISVNEVLLIIANSADPNEMQHCAAFHQALHCLTKNPFKVSRVQRVNP